MIKQRFTTFFLVLLFCLFPRYLAARSIPIKQIKIDGNTVLIPEINNLLANYQERGIDRQQLPQVVAAINNLYLERGYITSGAFLPQQKIIDGIAIVRVVEGKLENIEIDGLKRLRKNYINSRFRKVSEGVFNINNLQKALESLQVDPLIENVRAELVSGTESNTSILLVDIEEASVLEGSLTVNNWASPTIGEIRGIATLTHQNLLGFGDRAFAQYDLTEGFSNYRLEYRFPLNYRGTAIQLGYREGESRIIESPFDDADIRAEADTFSFSLIQTLLRSPNTESSLSLSFERSTSRTFIFEDMPFSFSDGPENGRFQLSVLRFSGDWLKRLDQSVISLISQLNFGLDLFDATINDNEPDGIFFSWLGQAQWARALNQERDIILITRLVTQLTPHSLLPLEKFTLGGATTVRGYRENRLVGDNGILGSVELAFSVIEDEWGELKLIPFFDLGRVWDVDGDFSQTLASLGLGLDWQFRNFVSFQLNFGLPLTDLEPDRDSLSDNGISFSVQLTP